MDRERVQRQQERTLSCRSVRACARVCTGGSCAHAGPGASGWGLARSSSATCTHSRVEHAHAGPQRSPGASPHTMDGRSRARAATRRHAPPCSAAIASARSRRGSRSFRSSSSARSREAHARVRGLWARRSSRGHACHTCWNVSTMTLVKILSPTIPPPMTCACACVGSCAGVYLRACVREKCSHPGEIEEVRATAVDQQGIAF